MRSADSFAREALPTSEDVLLVFVKYPIPGTVKTRLTPELTPKQAAELSRALSEDTLRAISNDAPRYVTTVCFSPPNVYERVRSWLGPELSLQEQCGEDLGSRQFHALRCSSEAGYRKSVLIGSDCPTITRGDIEAAFDALDGSDVVIGPSEDGGYYLIGVQRPIPSLFQGIRWGTDRVLRDTVTRAEAAGLTLELLDPKYDLDSYSDLERYYRSVRDGSECRLAGRSLEVMASIPVMRREAG